MLPYCHSGCGVWISILIKRVSIFSAAQLLTILGAKSLDLAWYVDEFKRICTNWDKYNEELNTLSVIHTRKYVSLSSLDDDHH